MTVSHLDPHDVSNFIFYQFDSLFTTEMTKCSYSMPQSLKSKLQAEFIY